MLRNQKFSFNRCLVIRVFEIHIHLVYVHPSTEIARHLPGGTGWLLPSLSQGDWAPYLANWVDVHGIRSPKELMESSVKHLMVTSPSSVTFDRLADASRELRYAAHYAYLMQKLALELWAQKLHSGSIYRVEDMAVMVVRFNEDFKRLSKKEDEKKFSLPEGLVTEIKFCDFRGEPWTCTGKLISAPIRLPENQGSLPSQVIRPRLLRSCISNQNESTVAG